MHKHRNTHDQNVQLDHNGLPVLPGDYTRWLYQPHATCPACDGNGATWDYWGGDACPIRYRAGFPPAVVGGYY
jgi:hypothetical protein